MGLIISRFRTKKSTIEVLEDIDKDINKLQKNRKQNQERQKKIVTSLLIYSIAAYVLSAIIFFVYYFPDTWKLRLLYSLPLLVFPVLIWGLKKLLHWYFVKRIASNDVALLKLREQKKQILEDVMETETYKKAKEILEKFDPVRFRKIEALPEAGSPIPVKGTPGTAMHQRIPAAPQQRQMPAGAIRTPVRPATPMLTPQQARPPVPQPRPRPTPTPAASTPYPATPRPSQSSSVRQPQQQQPLSAARQQQQQAMMGATPVMPRGYAPPPGPPMPRTVLPQQRGTMDRLMDYLVGDGPENRYALICQQCHSHNGMALKEEFEYLTFRCCYCFYVNPARKQRPMAPKLEFFAPRGRNLNTDSQGSAASEEDSDEEDDDTDEEKESGQSGARGSEANKGSLPDSKSKLGAGRAGGIGQASPGGATRNIPKGSGATANKSSNASSTGGLGSSSQGSAIPVRFGTAGQGGRPAEVRQASTPLTRKTQGLPQQSSSRPSLEQRKVSAAAADGGSVGGKTGGRPGGQKVDLSDKALGSSAGVANISSSMLGGKPDIHAEVNPDNVPQCQPVQKEQETEGEKNDNFQSGLGKAGASDSGTVEQTPVPETVDDGVENIPFADNDGDGNDIVSSLLNLQLSEKQAGGKEMPQDDMSSFVSGNTEDEEADMLRSGDFSKSVEGQDSCDAEESEQIDRPEEERLLEGDGGGEERGLTLSEEIRDSVKTLLSPTPGGGGEDVQDGGSTDGISNNMRTVGGGDGSDAK